MGEILNKVDQLPDADDTRDIGKPYARWANMHTANGFIESLMLDKTLGQAVTAEGGITPTGSLIPIKGSGGAVTVTASPAITAGSDGELLLLTGVNDTNTVTINSGTGVKLFGGSAEIGDNDKLLLVYNSTDTQWEEVSRNFASSEKSWSFASPTGGTGSIYYGGYYDFASSDNDFSPSTTHGTANTSYAAHFFTVLGATADDELTITVTGTSITDKGVRTTSDTENIIYINTSVAGTYKETAKKWIGQVTISIQSGTPVTCNYGYSKYWDNNNNDFRVVGLEATWLGGANDSTPDLKLIHHKSTGWTFNSGSPPTPPTAIASMNSDHNTEIQVRSGEVGAWKRSNLSTNVSGSVSEGTIIEVVTGTNKGFQIGNFMIRIRPN